MTYSTLKLVVAFVIMAAVGSAGAQPCGDLNEDGNVNIQDLVHVFDYIGNNITTDINLDNADCDGVSGVTVSDAYRLARYMFFLEPLDCNVAGAYSFAPSPSDTIFIPQLVGIPEDVDEVQMIVYGSFTAPIGGFYVPMLRRGPDDTGVFQYTDALPIGTAIGTDGWTGADTTVLFAIDMYGDGSLDGHANLFILKYDRVAPGIGTIVPMAIDREDPRLLAIERESDLVVPTVVYYEPAAPGLVSVSHDYLSFAAEADSPSPDSVYVTITSSVTPMTVSLVPSASWIVVDDHEYGIPWPTYETPATILITADATGMGVLDYEGSIDIYAENDGAWPPVDSIAVDLSVGAPPTSYPPGDFDCDGSVTIADLVLMVNFMFNDGPPLQECP